MALTEAQKGALIGAEQEALEEELSDDEQALERIAKGETEQDDDDDTPPAAAPAPAAPPAAAPAAAPVAQPAGTPPAEGAPAPEGAPEGETAEGEEEDDGSDVRGLLMPVPDVAGKADERSTLLEERKLLREKYKTGDITRDELDEKLDAISDQVEEINRALIQHDSAVQHNQQAMRAHFAGQVNAQIALAKADGIDYRKNAEAMEAWNIRVKTMGRDPAWVKRGDAAILKAAHQLTLEQARLDPQRFGLKAAPAPAAPAVDPKAAVKAAVAGRQPPASKVTTFAKVPEAAQTASGGEVNEFAEIEKLDGMDLERALAKMTPEQQERYLRAE